MNSLTLNSDFTFNDDFQVTEDVMKAFQENGYIILRSLLHEKETDILRSALENDAGIKQHAYELNATDDGRKTRMCLWNHPGNDVTGMIARSEKVAGTMEKRGDYTYIMARATHRGGKIHQKRLHDCLEKVILQGMLEGTRNVGKPPAGWLDDIKKYAESKSADATRIAEDCTRWRSLLLGGEVYHYTTKLIMKDARTGGKFIWHQDYGYWYHNGCVLTDMASFFLAVDSSTRENGCLQVLQSSHKCGRIEHVSIGGQKGADLERVNQIMKLLELVHVEMKAGDGLFFHCNLLHKSEKNDSDKRRWVLISSFNRASNNPYEAEPFPQYTPLKKVPNSAIEGCTDVTDMTGKDFLDPAKDKNVKVDKKK